MTLHLAIDLGAGSGRAILGRVGADSLDLQEVHRFHYAPREADGHLRWNAEALLQGIRAGLSAGGASAAALGRHVASVGVDAWGVDYGLIDQDGRLVEDPVCYRDGRTDGVMERVFAVVPREEIFARTGLQFMQLNTLFQLAAHAAEGLPVRAARLLLIPDLCHHVLCGAHVSELTDASTTQLLNARTGKWDDELFGRLHLPRFLMPSLVATGTDLGPLRPALAGGPGLVGARVVAPPTHDTASAIAATPLEPGWAYISSGTWSLVGIERPDPMLTEAASRANFTNEAGAFGTICFLKNVMGLWLLESCRREWAASGRACELADLLARAAAVPGFVGFVMPDAPRFFNPASMTREIAEALRATGQEAVDDPGTGDQGHPGFTGAALRVGARDGRARDGLSRSRRSRRGRRLPEPRAQPGDRRRHQSSGPGRPGRGDCHRQHPGAGHRPRRAAVPLARSRAGATCAAAAPVRTAGTPDVGGGAASLSDPQGADALTAGKTGRAGGCRRPEALATVVWHRARPRRTRPCHPMNLPRGV